MINQQRHLHYKFLHSNFYTTEGRITEVGDHYLLLKNPSNWSRKWTRIYYNNTFKRLQVFFCI